MKTFGKIIICILVVGIAIVIASLIFNKGKKNTTNTGANVANTENYEDKVNKDYIGLEENQEEPEKNSEDKQNEKDEDKTDTVVDESDKKEENTDKNEQQEEQPKEPELTGKDKAIDVVKKQYATDGQTVKFDHMQGEDYIVKLNDGTAVTWYLVNGTTWEAEEY